MDPSDEINTLRQCLKESQAELELHRAQVKALETERERYIYALRVVREGATDEPNAATVAGAALDGLG